MDRIQLAQTFRPLAIPVLAVVIILFVLSPTPPASAQALSEAEKQQAVMDLAGQYDRLDWQLIFEMDRVCGGYAGILDLEETVGYKMNLPEAVARLLLGQIQALGDILGLPPRETAQEAKRALKGDTAALERRLLKAYYQRAKANRKRAKEIGAAKATAFLHRNPTQEEMVAYCQDLADRIVQTLQASQVPLFDGPRDDPLFKKR